MQFARFVFCLSWVANLTSNRIMQLVKEFDPNTQEPRNPFERQVSAKTPDNAHVTLILPMTCP